MENKQRPVIAETRELVQKYHVLEKAQILSLIHISEPTRRS